MWPGNEANSARHREERVGVPAEIPGPSGLSLTTSARSVTYKRQPPWSTSSVFKNVTECYGGEAGMMNQLGVSAGWEVLACRSRNHQFGRFCTAIKAYPIETLMGYEFLPPWIASLLRLLLAQSWASFPEWEKRSRNLGLTPSVAGGRWCWVIAGSSCENFHKESQKTEMFLLRLYCQKHYEN